jgi:hypothetical protein
MVEAGNFVLLVEHTVGLRGNLMRKIVAGALPLPV